MPGDYGLRTMAAPVPVQWSTVRNYRPLIEGDESFGRRTQARWHRWASAKNHVIAAAYFQHRFMRNFRDELDGTETHPQIAKRIGMEPDMLTRIMNGTAANMQQYMAIVAVYGPHLLPSTTPTRLYPPPQLVDEGTRPPTPQETATLVTGRTPDPDTARTIATTGTLQLIVQNDEGGRPGNIIAVVADWYPGQAVVVT